MRCEDALPRSADLSQTVFEARTVGLIEFRRTSHRRDLRGLQRPDYACRRADDQGVFGELLAFGDHGARADDAAATDPGAVHHDRAHPDQRAILDRAAVQDHVMTDRAVLSDRQWKSPV